MILSLLKFIISFVKRCIAYIPSTVYDIVISRTLTNYSYERLFLQISKKYTSKVRVLDIGVGTGVPLFNVRDLLPQNSEVLGIDIDEAYIQKAKRLFKGIDNFQMELLNFYAISEKSHGKFDLIIFSSSFMLMP